ncbi:virulence factor Mce [Mycolicibacterium conceptionense]|uniref:Virulence factor Mce n=2 Tax=Mycolicibacterium TaxID=1866885 RepID=A0A1A2VHL1_9MYCO|nr:MULTISPECIES: MlaD family protein [Mycolicibacterium]MCW1820170.1 MCE family protein [Mycolicibacterium senegalense]OBB07309.1 virulence factor Mce [Mycolicibacterium conceptionense]OBF02705.1 virulence factor Mce [Mycolicibacterium conceptionense]OBF23452.1 virulence factor Mce [Mycolicibacterium conceptionense]OBF35251.1 virulence factor Mce [Mycolicibacterium conceptionense]
MLTRFVRIQLAIFAVASVIGMALMGVVYLQAPTLLGIGRMTVTLQLSGTGGLYQFSNVTYRGVQMGKVTEVRPTREGAQATLSLNTSPKVPADLHAAVLSVSAVGEQYVDLQPRTDSGPYLHDGSVIPVSDTSIPQAVGPMLDQVSALMGSIPKDKISPLLDETFKAFNGTGTDMGAMLDSSSRLIAEANAASDQTRALIEDGAPLLDGQAESVDAIRTWARSMAGITKQVTEDDQHVRTLLKDGPGTADEASRLFNQVKPTLPLLLANLTSLGQVGVTYHPSLEQLLVLLPPSIAATQSYGAPKNNPTGMSLGDFTLTMGDPPACTVGFLPPSAWRSPEDTSDIDTPDGLYCKLPQDSPIGVRGARNYPCMGKPGKRAPTVEICNSDQPYEPLAMRQHALGPYPIDPSLLAQGIAPDSRAERDAFIHGPVEGTPPPPPAQAPAPAEAPAEAPPEEVPPSDGGAPTVAPSAFAPNVSGGPSVAVATYDPRTGRYATPDGKVYRQTDLVPPSGDRTWKNLFTT